MVSEHEDKADSSCNRTGVDSDYHFVCVRRLQLLMDSCGSNIRIGDGINITRTVSSYMLVYCTNLSVPRSTYPYVLLPPWFCIGCAVIFF